MLIEKGIILSKYLYTIREHELCYDNVKDSILPAASDIIKIKAQKDSLACIFFNEKKNECMVYDNRPLECRALKCWDTREIEKIYSKNRLTRKDLLSNVEGLWGLVEDHQKRCSYEALTLFIDILKKEKKDKALKGILDIIEYDAQIRELVVQKGGLDPEMTDFIFGRAITETIRIYGFKIKKQDDNYRLIPVS
jgi:Fe-S-cluster containining protein